MIYQQSNYNLLKETMKKLIVIFLIIFPSFSFANINPEVFISGKFQFNSAITEQDSLYTQTNLPRKGPNNANIENNLNKDLYLAQDSHLDFIVVGKKDTGTLYGARAVIELDSQRQNTYNYGNSANNSSNGERENDNKSRAVIARKSFLFLERKTLGRLELGSVEGPSKKLKFDASYRFGGTGGVSGDWWKYINIPDFGLTYDNSKDDNQTNCSSDYALNDIRNCSTGGQGNKSFIIRPDLPLAHGYSRADGASRFDDTKTINRIAYYSPRISGFQIGASIAPDSGDRGSSYYGSGLSSNENSDVFNVIDVGINFVEQFDNIGVGFSFSWEKGKVEDQTKENKATFQQQDLEAYSIGSYVFLGNLSFSASYGYWGSSLSTVKEDLSSGNSDHRKKHSYYYTAGLAYEAGAFKLGASYFESKYREQELNLTSIALDYKMSKEFSIYVENNIYGFKAHADDEIRTAPIFGKTNNNKGQVLFVGMKLKFGKVKTASSILLDTQNNY